MVVLILSWCLWVLISTRASSLRRAQAQYGLLCAFGGAAWTELDSSCHFLPRSRLYSCGLNIFICKTGITSTFHAVSVRNCRRKTTPRVEKKDVLGTRLQGCHSQVQSEAAWLNWVVVGFIGGAKPWGRERVSGL
jgi:hypothetical protein